MKFKNFKHKKILLTTLLTLSAGSALVSVPLCISNSHIAINSNGNVALEHNNQIVNDGSKNSMFSSLSDGLPPVNYGAYTWNNLSPNQTYFRVQNNGYTQSNDALMNQIIQPLLNVFNNINLSNLIPANANLAVINQDILNSMNFNVFCTDVWSNSNAKHVPYPPNMYLRTVDGIKFLDVGWHPFGNASETFNCLFGNNYPNEPFKFVNATYDKSDLNLLNAIWKSNGYIQNYKGQFMPDPLRWPATKDMSWQANIPWNGGCTKASSPFEFIVTFNPTGINNRGYLDFNVKVPYLNYQTQVGNLWDGSGLCVGTSFMPAESIHITYNVNLSFTMPFDINTIINNIQQATWYGKTYKSPVWQPSLEPIAQQMLANAEKYIPSYLENAINIHYTLDNYNNQINWTVNCPMMNGNNAGGSWSTYVVLPPRPNLQQIYTELQNYLETPITLYSNTSSVFNSSNVPQYVAQNLENALNTSEAESHKALPTSIGYVSSQADINNYGVLTGSFNKYYAGNLTAQPSDMRNYWQTTGLLTNQQILTNYVNKLMDNFLAVNMNAFYNPDAIGNVGFKPTYSISFQTNPNTQQAEIVVTFVFKNVPDKTLANQPSPWIFTIPIQAVNTSSFCVATKIADQLTLTGQPAPQVGANQTVEMVPVGLGNSGIQITKPQDNNGGIRLFYSTVNLEFKASTEQNQTITVNGNPLPIYNNVAKTSLASPSETNKNNGNNNAVSTEYPGFNQYVIDIYQAGDLVYTVTVYIGNTAPQTDIAYYAWNPSVNPEQKLLVTPQLADGKPNPKYNPNINPNTGTTTQLLWVNQTSQIPMYADPFNENGQPTKNGNNSIESTGFLACGQVINKGVKVSFPATTSDVYRTGLSFDPNSGFVKSDNPTGDNSAGFENVGITTQIQPSGTDNPYFSYSGFWNYSVRSTFPGQQLNQDKTGIWGQYLVCVNNNTNANTSLFTEQVNKIDPNQTYVVPFWDSYHGKHLMNFLMNDQGFTSEQCQKMDYTQALQWWNFYCVLGTSNNLENNGVVNLAMVDLDNLNINIGNKQQVIDTIKNYIQSTLNGQYNLVPQEYSINIDDSAVNAMLAKYNQNQIGSMTVSIVANPEYKTQVTGQTTLTVIDNPNLLNIANGNWGMNKNNIPGTDVTPIENWIKQTVQTTLQSYFKQNDKVAGQNVTLKLGVDYSIDLSNAKDLLLDPNENICTKTAKIKVSALPTSKYLWGTTEIPFENSTLINPKELVLFNNMDIQNLYFKLANANPKYVQIVISNYIFEAIKNAFDAYFTNHPEISGDVKNQVDFEWNDTIYSNDHIVYPSTYGSTWVINGYTEKLQELTQDIDQDSFNNVVSFCLSATLNSNVTSGTSLFKVSNSLSNPANPNVPGMPDNPSHEVDKGQNPNGQKNGTLGSAPIWILAIVVPLVVLIVAVIWLVVYRQRKKKLDK